MGWFAGAFVGFLFGFLLQAVVGHWKLWVDQRNAVMKDLIDAVDGAAHSGVDYFRRETIPGGKNEPAARDVRYKNDIVVDLYGIIDRRFGPFPRSVQMRFWHFRDTCTGPGFMAAGPGDEERATNILGAAAVLEGELRDWACEQLGPVATTTTWWARRGSDRPRSS